MAEETKAGGNWVAGALPKFLVIVAVLLIVSVFVFGVKLTNFIFCCERNTIINCKT